MNVTTTQPRSVAASLYEAAVAADPARFEDLPWDLLEREKQAPWIAIANRAEALFQEGHLPTTPDPLADPVDLERALAPYFTAAANAAARILPAGAERDQVRSKIMEAGFWASCALGV